MDDGMSNGMSKIPPAVAVEAFGNIISLLNSVETHGDALEMELVSIQNRDEFMFKTGVLRGMHIIGQMVINSFPDELIKIYREETGEEDPRGRD